MKYLPVKITALVLSLAALVAPVQAQTTTKELSLAEAAALREKLDALIRKLDASKRLHNSKAVAVFTTAAQSGKSALDLYHACVKAHNFERLEKRESDFRDWKNANSSLHRSDEFQMGLRLQLIYLIATIAAADAEKLEDAIPAIRNYVNFYLQIEHLLIYPEELKRGADRLRDTVRANALGTAFAKHYKLNITVRPRSGWPSNPTEIDQVFDDVLLPHYRDTRNLSSLVSTWDLRIAHLKKIALAHQENEGLDRLSQIGEEELPALLWQRATDIYHYGDQSAGAKAMLAVVTEHLEHPESYAWLEELELVLENRLNPPSTPEPEPETASEEDRGKTLSELLSDGES